jgi:flotillin
MANGCCARWQHQPEAIGLDPNFLTILGATSIGLVFFTLLIVLVYRNLYVPVGPNEALVISGGPGSSYTDENGVRQRIGYRIVSGGGTLVNPILERVAKLSLELIPIEIAPMPLTTRLSEVVTVGGAGQIKVLRDENSLRKAAELFLSKPVEDIRRTARDVILGHLAATVSSSNTDDVCDKPEILANRVSEAASIDMAKMGIGFVSFSLSSNASQRIASS